MAANKGKAQGGKKKKTGKNGKVNSTTNSKSTTNQANDGSDNTPECLKRLQTAVAAFMAVLERKLKKSPQQRTQAAQLAHVSLVVITGCEDRAAEHVESLIPIFDELCEHENAIWTPTGQSSLISTLSDKFTKWASAQGLLYQYTRALVDGSTNPIEDASQIVDSATRDYGKIAQTILDYSNNKNGNDDTNGEKEATGPSLDSMIEALSASGVEVSAKEASSASSTQQQSQSQSSSTQPQPKDPKQVAQAFLMFKPYMSQMIEARRKAEQQLHVLEANVAKLSKRVEEYERTQEPQLLSKDVEAVYQPDPRLTLENNTKEL